jgi:hypothetical protein
MSELKGKFHIYKTVSQVTVSLVFPDKRENKRFISELSLDSPRFYLPTEITAVPPYLLIQYPRFTAAGKKKLEN